MRQPQNDNHRTCQREENEHPSDRGEHGFWPNLRMPKNSDEERNHNEEDCN